MDSRGFAQAKLYYFHIYRYMLSIVGTTYFLRKIADFLQKKQIKQKIWIYFTLKMYFSQAPQKRPLLYRGEGYIKQGLE